MWQKNKKDVDYKNANYKKRKFTDKNVISLHKGKLLDFLKKLMEKIITFMDK